MKTIKISTLNYAGSNTLELPKLFPTKDYSVELTKIETMAGIIQTLIINYSESKEINATINLVNIISHNIHKNVRDLIEYSDQITVCQDDVPPAIEQIAQLILLSKPIIGLICIMDPIQKFNSELIYIYKKRTLNYKLPKENLSPEDDPYSWAPDGYRDNKIEVDYL